MAANPFGSRSALHDALDRNGWTLTRLTDTLDHLPVWELDTALRLALDLAGASDRENLEQWRQALYTESRRRQFPERLPAPSSQVQAVAGFFFPLAQAVIDEQARRGGDGIAERLPFRALAESEIAPWPSADEYRRLLAAMERDALLACNAMAQQWLGFSISDHVLGVTGLALWIGRQLGATVPVDLPLLHGAAIGHDVGKFGCLGDEERRIPRLHYYYTHAWYQARNLPSLGHIATNHSTWDLEGVRLPIETLLLIYADFRVKDSAKIYGVRRMSIISLHDAFTEIRDKLENLDVEKLRRYRAVYRKLRDLEDYALEAGVDVDPPTFATRRPPKPKLPKGLSIVDVLAGRRRPDAVALATGPEIASVSRFFTTAHDLGVMEKLRDVPAARALLEEARSFEGWRDLRTYIGILGEYSRALSMEQKELALDFFFELLAHRDDDIRYHAANRIGDLIALGEDLWRKDLPEGVVPAGGNWPLRQLERVLALLDIAGAEPEDDMGATEKVLYSLPLTLRRLVRHAEPKLRADALETIFESLSRRIGDQRPLVGLYACECCEVLLPLMRSQDAARVLAITRAWSEHSVVNTRLMAWRVLLGLAQAYSAEPGIAAAAHDTLEKLAGRMTDEALVAELFLLGELALACGRDDLAARCRELRAGSRNPVQEVMLRNLKTRVGWVEKKVNLDYLVAVALARVKDGRDPEAHFGNEVAIHLANLLKVSRVEGTRFHAGRSLLRLLPVLTVTQRNDLMIELLRSLQLDVEAVTRYIPRFLGPVLASLPDQEFLEGLEDVEVNVRSGAESLQRLLLQTVGWLILSLAPERLQGGVMRRLGSVLLGALAETRANTVHEGFAQIAMVLDRLSRAPARGGTLALFLRLVTKKLLSLVTHKPGDRGRFFLVASALSRMDLAISRVRPRVRFPERPSVAFLPGTFDPFTRAHSEIVDRVLASADEILVQVDDYSWNKHAQPREVRKELAWMALAGVPEAFEAPFEPPVNLTNPVSVKTLRRKLEGRDLTVAVGTDVLEGASAYRDAESPLWDVDHLVVVRENGGSSRWEEQLGRFRARAQVLRLPPRTRGVSSSSLRLALDRGEEIEALCDPLIGRTLKERQLYVNYPSKKLAVRPPRFSLTVERGQTALPASLRTAIHLDSLPAADRWAGKHREACVLSAREGGTPLAALAWREVAAAALPVVLGDRELASVSGRGLAGLGALIETVAGGEGAGGDRLLEALLSAAMGRWLDAGLQFAVAGFPAEGASALWDAMERCGARWLTDRSPRADGGPSWAAIGLTDPLVLLWDLESVLQPPYAAAPEVSRVVEQSRQALAAFFCSQAPGSAVFHLAERETKRTIVERAIARIAEDRGKRRWIVLGLGRQFYRDVIGDTPTLALDLERFLTGEGYESGFHASPRSPSLELQLHTARELGRDALLIAPFLETEEPVLRVRAAAYAAGLSLREVLIGVTSASVHATLHLQGIAHTCSVIVPRWRGVIRESALAPYIGGWSIEGRDPLHAAPLVPSLNDCLPYHHPHPFGLDGDVALDFSRMALEHTRRLFERLEEVFRRTEGRILTLRDLGAVVRTPRCPPFPQGFAPPRDRVPSELLADDLEALARLHPETHEAHRSRWRGV